MESSIVSSNLPPLMESDNETVIDLSENDFNRLLNSDRVKLMKEKMKTITDRVTHLSKIRNRWNSASNTVRWTSMIVSFILTVTSAVINVLPSTVANDAVVRALTAGFSAVAAVTMVTSEGTLVSYIKRNKKKYNSNIRDLQRKIDSCHLYYEKSRSDGMISNEELVAFYNILKEGDVKI